ncbi:MAG: DNA mismatch repair protein MutS, partial [Clostridia bacterium]|nr:DNA mismatch repair protein MutS [Clostridia bacterium]
MENKLSPMMQHYLEVKDKHKDCIVFYRLGDFYEMFFDDAVKASKMLDLTLTGRDCGLPERAPMCGIPYHAADMYISKLVQMGEKVAICEQLTEPQKGVKLVERDVIKIVTAGTFTNDELIDDKSNNFLASIYLTDGKTSVSWADITTGEFYAKSFEGNNYITKTVDLLTRISPVEIIGNSKAAAVFNSLPQIESGEISSIKDYLDGEYELNNATNSLKTQFGVLTVDSYGFEDNSAICSSGALVAYLKETQKHSLSNITTVKVERFDECMILDSNAVRNLELVKTLKDGKRYGSLLWLLDKTKTSMGARKLQSRILTPLNDVNKINDRLNAVNSLFNANLIRESISEILSSVRDVGRITGKISNGNLTPNDCIALAISLENIPSLKFQLAGISEELITDISDKLYDFSELTALLFAAIDDGSKKTEKEEYSKEKPKIIREGFDKELDRLRNLKENSVSAIVQMESAEREKTGIKNLKIRYNRVFGYYIEVTNSFKEYVPLNYIRRQTLAGAERYYTEDLKNLENEILLSGEKAEALENKIFSDIKLTLSSQIDKLKDVSDAISELDVFVALATVAKENGYVMPKIKPQGSELKIVAGRHPVVEKISKQRFVPNDVLLDSDENRTIILTGPNMAGKSTYMRQTALITIMAHIGSFVSADLADIPLTDKIFTRIGASDNLISNQSTFMVEMSEVANIVKNATKNSLLILDEIGRGTSTFDGLSIAWAVVEYVNNVIGAKTLFATHYHELTELEGVLDGVKNYKVAVKEMGGGIVFVRKIMRGG